MGRREMNILIVTVLSLASASGARAGDFDCSGFKDHDKVVAYISGQKSCAKAASIFRGCSRIWQSSTELMDAALEVCEQAFQDRLSEKQKSEYDKIAEACAVKMQSKVTMKIFWPGVRACRVMAAEAWERRHSP